MYVRGGCSRVFTRNRQTKYARRHKITRVRAFPVNENRTHCVILITALSALVTEWRTSAHSLGFECTQCHCVTAAPATPEPTSDIVSDQMRLGSRIVICGISIVRHISLEYHVIYVYASPPRSPPFTRRPLFMTARNSFAYLRIRTQQNGAQQICPPAQQSPKPAPQKCRTH